MKSSAFATSPRVLAILLGMAIALPATALERGKKLTISDKELGQELISSVENAIWAADGSNARKPVYVIYGTDCSISQDLFNKTRGLSEKVQLRWIASSGTNAAYVVDRRNSASVGKSFSGGGSLSDTAKAQRFSDYNESIPSSISYLLRDLDASGKFAYPTLVYSTPRGVKVVSGTPDNIAAIAGEVLALPEKAANTSAIQSLLAAPVQVSPSHNLKNWGPAESTAVFRAAPSLQAAPLFDLDTDHTMTVSGIVADGGWIETIVGDKKAYAHAPLDARMALLDFRARPASGFVDPRQQVAIHQFPHLQSRILKTASAGSRYRRIGTVDLDGRIWDQVVFYEDGRPGYVLR